MLGPLTTQQALVAQSSVGSESGMDDDSASDGTAVDDDGAASNLTGSQQSTSGIAPDEEQHPGSDGASKPN